MTTRSEALFFEYRTPVAIVATRAMSNLFTVHCSLASPRLPAPVAATPVVAGPLTASFASVPDARGCGPQSRPMPDRLN